MAAPTAPYCGTDDVAALVPQIVRSASDFSAETTPTKAAVTKLLTWCSAEIDHTFASVGFYVPYEEISGESWNTAQTYMLELMNAIGTAGMIVGPVIKPAPAMGSQRGSTDNNLLASYKNFLQSIKQDGAGFRMRYRSGSKAEQFCRAPRGPLTDYLNGYLDYTLFQTVKEYTNVVENMRDSYNMQTSKTWDHLKTKRDSLLA
jgi:hypothetical protein